MNDEQEIKELLNPVSECSEQVEWKNGDKAMWCGRSVLVIGYHPEHPVIVIDTDDGLESVGVCDLYTPETPEQKQARERLEAAYDLCMTAYPDYCTLDEFKDGDAESINKWLAIVDKTNYRKPELLS